VVTKTTASSHVLEYTSGALNNDGTITQHERLFTARARYDVNKQGQLTGGDRGTRAFFRVLTNDQSATRQRGESLAGYGKATSLTNGPNVLNQALSSGTRYGGYASFLVTNVSGSLNEKAQVMETFGDGEVVYYFGRSPIIINISGFVIDSPDNNWFIQWLEMYAHVLRGTQLARNYELARLVLPNMEIVGSVSGTSWNQSSDNDVAIQFQFQIIAKEIKPIPVTFAGTALTYEVGFLDFSDPNGPQSQAQINSIKNYTAILQDSGTSMADRAAAMAGLGTGVGGTIAGIDNIAAQVSEYVSSPTSLFSTVNTNLNGIRASLFSPVYGVLSSLTRLVRVAGGGLESIFSSFTTPVRDILRDVQNISAQAIGLVDIVTNSINRTTGQLVTVDNMIATTIGTVKDAAGGIASAPETLTDRLRNLVNAGTLPITTAFLQNRPRASLGLGEQPPTKIALLYSGDLPLALRGATV